MSSKTACTQLPTQISLVGLRSKAKFVAWVFLPRQLFHKWRPVSEGRQPAGICPVRLLSLTYLTQITLVGICSKARFVAWVFLPKQFCHKGRPVTEGRYIAGIHPIRLYPLHGLTDQLWISVTQQGWDLDEVRPAVHHKRLQSWIAKVQAGSTATNDSCLLLLDSTCAPVICLR